MGNSCAKNIGSPPFSFRWGACVSGAKVAILTAVISVILAVAMQGCANVGLQPQFKAQVMMTRGDKVRLFYGGTQEAKSIFCVGETVSVYRPDLQDPRQSKEVGKVKILRALNDQFLEGEVVSGKVMEGDLAKKDIAACMVLPLRPQK
jgi:hypothetical protein